MFCSGGRGGASTTALLIKRAHVVSRGVLRQKCRIQEDLSSHRVHHAVSRGAHRSSVQSVERASLSYRGSVFSAANRVLGRRQLPHGHLLSLSLYTHLQSRQFAVREPEAVLGVRRVASRHLQPAGRVLGLRLGSVRARVAQLRRQRRSGLRERDETFA